MPVGRPFPPGHPLTLRPRTVQAAAFQQAAELVADAVGEPFLRLDPADPDPAGTLIARVRRLSPSKRKSLNAALAAVCVELLGTANLLLHSGMIASATQLLALALALWRREPRGEGKREGKAKGQGING